MKSPICRVLVLFALFVTPIVYGQNGAFPDTISVLWTDQLPLGEEVRTSGKRLISQPYGFTQIRNRSTQDNAILHVAVHGYKSEGYEWVAPLVKLAEAFEFTFFYRFDWEVCPDSAAETLASVLDTLISRSPGTEKLVLFGHSYGGMVVTFCASMLHLNIPVEVHTIASPLAGLSLLAECESMSDGKIVYPPWDKDVQHIQWRTIHQLDNAFNKLPDDPQEIDLTNSKFFRLPPTMDGHRLGHNWSVTWVIDEYLRIPHKP